MDINPVILALKETVKQRISFAILIYAVHISCKLYNLEQYAKTVKVDMKFTIPVFLQLSKI